MKRKNKIRWNRVVMFYTSILLQCIAVYLYIAQPGTETNNELLTKTNLHDSAIKNIQEEKDWTECIKTTFPGFPPPSYYTHEKPILVYTWHSLKGFLYIDSDAVKSCETPCLIVSDYAVDDDRCAAHLDAYLFNPPTETARPVYPQQTDSTKWVLFSTESESIWPQLTDAAYMRRFDVNMTYHLDATVPITYFISERMYTHQWPMQWTKRDDAPLVMFVSNCDPRFVASARGQLITRLVELMPVHSYGKCFNNRMVPHALRTLPWWEQKWNITSQYKFVLALENSVQRDYVTEKLFHAFVAGVVPVYLGAPNVERFTPSRRSVIRVDDFGSVEELVNYLMYLNEHDEAYREYLQWKIDGVSEQFKALASTSPRTAPCRLCSHLKRMQRESKNLK